MFEDLTGFNRVLAILARGYMFDKGGNADIARAERAIRAWCSVPDKKKAKPLEDWQYTTDFRSLHDEFPEHVDKNGKGWLYRHIANIVAYVKKNPDKVSQAATTKTNEYLKGFEKRWREKIKQFHTSIYDTDWIVISHINLDGYLGYGTFTKKLLATIPEDILIRSTNHGVNRYKIMPEFLP